MKHPFYFVLKREIINSVYNNHKDNYDNYRFGKENSPKILSKQYFFDLILSNRVVKNYEFGQLMANMIDLIEDYGEKLTKVYDILEDKSSQEWLVKLLAYRILGYKKVKLQTNNIRYISFLKNQKSYFNEDKFIEANFLGEIKKINLVDLYKLDIPLKLYTHDIYTQFIDQQYNYNDFIKVEKGDFVIDCGACTGDSSLDFAHLTGEKGKVFGFEFIPSNCKVFNQNIELNPDVKDQVEIVPRPVWSKSGLKMYYKDHGPGSKVEFENFKDSEGNVLSISIDDFVKENNIEKINFIKMDIEGAESFALEGARETILKFKPKLAISSYHSMDDYVNIPLWIKSLNLGYKIYIGHSTIHWEETVVFAIID